MKIRRAAFRFINHALSLGGFELQQTALDFDSRLVDGDDLADLFAQLATALGGWFQTQRVLRISEEVNLVNEIGSFYAQYLDAPFRVQHGGSRFNNLMCLFLAARLAKPTLIIDSGSYRGASAWALKLGAPTARVLSFDIDMSRLVLRASGVEYITADWATFDFRAADPATTLCYFDDHVDQVRRVLESRKRGLKHLIFDDDFPVSSFASMARDNSPLPKISFALDDRLASKSHLTWVAAGRKQRWPIDVRYLESAREVIAETDRFPDTGLITGIWQTPYRVVTLK